MTPAADRHRGVELPLWIARERVYTTDWDTTAGDLTRGQQRSRDELAPAKAAADLLLELRAAGVTLVAAIDLAGPAEALTDATIAETRRLKGELLRLLVGDTTTTTPREESAIGGSGVGVTPPTPETADPGTGDAAAADVAYTPADVSHTPAATACTDADVAYTAAERELLDVSSPSVRQAALAVKAAFRGVDELMVFEIVPSRSKARDAAARIIRETHHQDGCRARDLRDAWEERLAICTMDGELSIRDAEAIALKELGSRLAERQG